MSQIPASVFFFRVRKILDLALRAIKFYLDRITVQAFCQGVYVRIRIGLDSFPDEQLTLDGAWRDDRNEENSPEPAQLKRFGPVEGESVLPTGPHDLIASLATRAQRHRAWSETNGSLHLQPCHASRPAMPAQPWPPGHLSL